MNENLNKQYPLAEKEFKNRRKDIRKIAIEMLNKNEWVKKARRRK